jgi:uncharacterized membrane protein YhfC
MVVTAPIAGLLEILIPIFFGFWLVRRYGTKWSLVGIGALLFIASQVVHIPLLKLLTALFQNGTLPTPPEEWNLVFNAVVLGLMAGLCEETARWIGFSLLKGRARTWAAGMTVGIGHGGVESIFVGVSVLATFVVMVISRDNPSLLSLSGSDLATLQSQVSAYWAAAWTTPLAGLLERISAITLHLSLSVLVLQTVLKRTSLFFILAVLWHAVVDGMSVYLVGIGMGTWMLEAVMFGFALLSLAIILVLRKQQPSANVNAQPVAVPD